MTAVFAHRAITVKDKAATISFYEKALGMFPVKEVGPDDGSWTKTFMGSDASDVQLEITWFANPDHEYDNGAANDSHIAFRVDDFDAALEKHRALGCVVKEEPHIGVYFIADPEGQMIEILPPC